MNRQPNAMDYVASGQNALQELAQAAPALLQAAQQLQASAAALRPGGGAGAQVAQGRFQRLQKVQQQYQAALQGGTGAQVADAREALQKSLGAFKPAAGPAGIGQRLAQLVSSTRINMGPISPLLGKVTGALGATGPQGAMAGAALTVAVELMTLQFRIAVEGVKLFVGVIEKATEAAKGFADARIQTGGTGGNIAFLRAFGLDAGQIPAVAAHLRERLSGSPFGQVAGHNMGLGAVLPRNLMPGMNEAALVQNVVKGLAGIQDAGERFKQAVLLDATSLLPQVEFYRRHRDSVDADSKVMEQIADPALQQAAGDMAGQIERLRTNFLSAVLAFAKPFLKPIADFIGRVADRFRDLADWLNKNQAIITALRDAFVNLTLAFLDLGKGLGYIIGKIGDFLVSINPPGSEGQKQASGLAQFGGALYRGAEELKKLIMGDGADNLQSAMDNLTGAVKDNTVALKQGTFGGGERTRRALQQRFPGTWPAAAFDRAVAGNAYRLGAF